jgi:hypothetical protein
MVVLTKLPNLATNLPFNLLTKAGGKLARNGDNRPTKDDRQELVKGRFVL